jgi:hypothetical protein
LRDRADAVTRYLHFLVDGLILGSIALLLHRISFDPARVGLQLVNWKRDILVGVTAGILLVAMQRLIIRRASVDPKHDFTYRVRKGSPLLWVFIFVTGAFSEELWTAVCLVTLKAGGFSSSLSVVMTIVVFAAGHYSYGLWGACAVALKEVVSALLFLHFGSLFVTFFYHFIGNLGSLYWNRYWASGGWAIL